MNFNSFLSFACCRLGYLFISFTYLLLHFCCLQIASAAPLSLEFVREIKKAARATLNDIFVAAFTGAVRRSVRRCCCCCGSCCCCCCGFPSAQRAATSRAAVAAATIRVHHALQLLVLLLLLCARAGRDRAPFAADAAAAAAASVFLQVLRAPGGLPVFAGAGSKSAKGAASVCLLQVGGTHKLSAAAQQQLLPLLLCCCRSSVLLLHLHCVCFFFLLWVEAAACLQVMAPAGLWGCPCACTAHAPWGFEKPACMHRWTPFFVCFVFQAHSRIARLVSVAPAQQICSDLFGAARRQQGPEGKAW